jgi:hypothetical protein
MTKEEITNIVTKHMSKIKLEYDQDIEIQCGDKEPLKRRDETTKDTYIVSFKTPDHVEYNTNGEIISLIEGYYCFCYVDAESYDILYYHKPHGHIEVDGTGHWI